MNPATDVTDNPAAQRFEWTLGDATAIVTYRRDGAVLWLNHAGVPAALGGRGIGITHQCALRELQSEARGVQLVATQAVSHLVRELAAGELAR